MIPPSSHIIPSCRFNTSFSRAGSPVTKIVSWDIELKDEIKVPTSKREVAEADLAFIYSGEEKIVVIKSRYPGPTNEAISIEVFQWLHFHELWAIHLEDTGVHIHYPATGGRVVTGDRVMGEIR